jgi:hypothetical protein
MNLSNLLQNLYSDTGQTDPEYGNFVATGGSATTIINTGWASLESPPEEDTLKNRVAFIQSTTDGLTPQGKWGKVSAYAEATNTMTISTVTDAVGAGDVIILAKQTIFPLQETIFRVNRALTNLGDVPIADVSLTTVSDKTEYALPLAAKRGLLQVFYQTETGDVDDNRWTQISNWSIQPGAAGSTGLLILPQLPPDRTLKLVYMGTHPTVSLYSDYISEYVHPKIATLAAMLECLKWYNNRDENQGANEYFTWLMQNTEQQLTVAKIEFPIWKPARTPQWFTESRYAERSQDPNRFV